VGFAGRAGADFIATDRLSEITFNGVNLGTGGEPGPDAFRRTTDLSEAFSQTLADTASVTVIGGAHNTGSWSISQNTTILPAVVSSSTSQSATTATDFDSPGIFTASVFNYAFHVDASTPIQITGSVVGSSDPANDDFARVQLLQGAAALFSTSFPSGTFPFTTTLQPGNNYTFMVESKGETLFNNSTNSSANATLSIVPEPATLGQAVCLAAFASSRYLHAQRRRRDGAAG
jgi:hypothetical protein